MFTTSLSYHSAEAYLKATFTVSNPAKCLLLSTRTCTLQTWSCLICNFSSYCLRCYLVWFVTNPVNDTDMIALPAYIGMYSTGSVGCSWSSSMIISSWKNSHSLACEIVNIIYASEYRRRLTDVYGYSADKGSQMAPMSPFNPRQGCRIAQMSNASYNHVCFHVRLGIVPDSTNEFAVETFVKVVLWALWYMINNDPYLNIKFCVTSQAFLLGARVSS